MRSNCALKLLILGGERGLLLFEHVEEQPVIVREVHGIVSQVQDGLSFDHDHATYRLTFVPRMWLTTLHETLDIHMDMTVPEIIAKVLKRACKKIPRERVIGRVNGVWVVEWRFVPANYILAIHLDAPKPLMQRVDPADTLSPRAWG